MKTSRMPKVFVASLAIMAIAGVLQAAAVRMAGPAAGQGDVARGQYIVHHVAMCVQCHSPRDDAGNLITAELLAGAPMPVKSPYAGLPFAYKTPRLAGLPSGWAEDAFVRFLETGNTGDRPGPMPPMPPFRMTETDARAVAAYLKSLR